MVLEFCFTTIWRPPSLSKLTPMISNMGLTHLGWDASIYKHLEKILFEKY